jgi:glucose-6-phosphate 1-dehydrogenase
MSELEASSCPCVVAVFGASGDLTRRKLMPALFRLDAERRLHERFAVVGFARSELGDDAFRRAVREGLAEHAGASGEAVDRFVSRLHYVAGGYDDDRALAALRAKLDAVAGARAERRELYYFALPPTVVETLLAHMKTSGFVPQPRGEGSAKIMVEKPFGHNLASARRLNALLAGLVDERCVYRIDHYLAKDTVRNLLVLRFTNAVFEPLWNRYHIDNVQITAAEDIALEGRGSYYEEAGVVRDMLQNHVMQVLALVAMEPPVAHDAESVRDRTVEIFKSLSVVEPDHFVLGQYRGYRDEKNVRPDSAMPTFAAMKLHIDNWRWHGVPFYIRSGKALARKVTEIVVCFKSVPLCVVGDQRSCAALQPNRLAVRIQPDEGMRLSFVTRTPGVDEHVAEAHMNFRYAELGGAPAGGYERVILDGIEGRPSLFWRNDGIEVAWRAVEPILDRQGHQELATYEPGTWGPAASTELLARDGRRWFESY